MLAVVIEAMEETQSQNRHSLRDRAARQFDEDRIVKSILAQMSNAIAMS